MMKQENPETNVLKFSPPYFGLDYRILFFRLFKKVQMRGARRAMSGGVLMYVDAKSVERNDAGEPFSTAC